jgi:hypothetical protein
MNTHTFLNRTLTPTESAYCAVKTYNSASDFSGIQGANGWYYGYYNNGVFTQFTNYQATQYITSLAWNYNANSFGYISSTVMQPNGASTCTTISYGNIAPVLRWINPYISCYKDINIYLSLSPGTGNVLPSLTVNGNSLYAPTTASSYTNYFNAYDVSRIELSIGPKNGNCDAAQTTYSLIISPMGFSNTVVTSISNTASIKPSNSVTRSTNNTVSATATATVFYLGNWTDFGQYNYAMADIDPSPLGGMTIAKCQLNCWLNPLCGLIVVETPCTTISLDNPDVNTVVCSRCWLKLTSGWIVSADAGSKSIMLYDRVYPPTTTSIVSKTPTASIEPTDSSLNSNTISSSSSQSKTSTVSIDPSDSLVSSKSPSRSPIPSISLLNSNTISASSSKSKTSTTSIDPTDSLRNSRTNTATASSSATVFYSGNWTDYGDVYFTGYVGVTGSITIHKCMIACWLDSLCGGISVNWGCSNIKLDSSQIYTLLCDNCRLIPKATEMDTYPGTFTTHSEWKSFIIYDLIFPPTTSVISSKTTTVSPIPTSSVVTYSTLNFCSDNGKSITLPFIESSIYIMTNTIGEQYINNLACSVSIYGAGNYQQFRINISSFNTDGCCDFFTVYNSNNNIVARYSNNVTSGTNFIANGPYIRVAFTSDGSVVASGVFATVTLEYVSSSALPSLTSSVFKTKSSSPGPSPSQSSLKTLSSLISKSSSIMNSISNSPLHTLSTTSCNSISNSPLHTLSTTSSDSYSSLSSISNSPSPSTSSSISNTISQTLSNLESSTNSPSPSTSSTISNTNSHTLSNLESSTNSPSPSTSSSISNTISQTLSNLESSTNSPLPSTSSSISNTNSQTLSNLESSTNSPSPSTTSTISNSYSSTLSPAPSPSQVNLISFKLNISLADQLNNYLNYLLSSGGILPPDEALSLINTIPQVGISDTMNILKKLGGVISEPISFSSTNFEGGLAPIKNTTVEVSSALYNINVPVIPNLPPNSSVVAISWSNTTTFSNETTLSNIISVSVSNKGVDQSVRNLTSPIVLTWNISDIINPPNMTLKCSYWNYTSSSWRSDGCNITVINNILNCECDHMTDFVARFERIAAMNKNIFENAGNVYSLDGLNIYKNYYIFYGCYFITMILIGIGLQQLDIKNSEQYLQSLKQNFDIIKFKKDIKEFYIDKCYIYDKIDEFDEYNDYKIHKYKLINEIYNKLDKDKFENKKELFEYIQLLVDEELENKQLFDINSRLVVNSDNSPKDSDSKNKKIMVCTHILKLISLWWKRLLYQHNYLSILFKYDPQSPRIFRVFFIFTVISHTLFMTALLYGYTHNLSGGVEATSPIMAISLSIITSIINVPFMNFIMKILQLSGKYEFEWRYPFIFREIKKMIIFEEVYYNNNNNKNNTHDIIKNEHEDNIITNILVNYIFKYFNCCKRSDKNIIKSKDEIFKDRIDKEVVKIKDIPLESKWWYTYYLPFHTPVSTASFMGCLGYLIWTINYLLLFSANTKPEIQISIMESFGISQLFSIFIMTPITLLITLLFTWVYHKYIKKTSVISNMIPLYYHSDPFVNDKSFGLTVRLTKSLFLKSIAESSINQPTDPRIIAPVKGLVAQILEEELINYMNKEYYNKLIKYNQTCVNL